MFAPLCLELGWTEEDLFANSTMFLEELARAIEDRNKAIEKQNGR